MEDRETTGIKVGEKVHRLTGIGFQVWLTLARLNIEKKGAPRGVTLQQLANRLESDGRIKSWQKAIDTARWYTWHFKKHGLIKETDTDAADKAA
jgi:hypothetical protein